MIGKFSYKWSIKLYKLLVFNKTILIITIEIKTDATRVEWNEVQAGVVQDDRHGGQGIDGGGHA